MNNSTQHGGHQRPQLAEHLLMVRPSKFGYNPETAKTNAFQTRSKNAEIKDIQKKAKQEFDHFVALLRENGVKVTVAKDSAQPPKPDAVFPNNWVIFSQEGQIITFPMESVSRRKERRSSIINLVISEGFSLKKRINLEFNERIGEYLEGTGSVVFDHPNRLAYACLSPRTHESVLRQLCEFLGYEPVIFHAFGNDGTAIYHTNVVMAIGLDFVVIGMDAVEEKAKLKRIFKETGKEIIALSMKQINQFAGNMLQVRTEAGDPLLIMSEQAYKSLTEKQLKKIKRKTKILHAPIYTIEKYGGGSARCMMAEVFC